MWFFLWRQTLDLISAARCRACSGPIEAGVGDFCKRCHGQLALPEGGLQGDQPLLWCALAPYAGSLRALLLRQRPTVDPALIHGPRHTAAQLLRFGVVRGPGGAGAQLEASR